MVLVVLVVVLVVDRCSFPISRALPCSVATLLHPIPSNAERALLGPWRP